jgi:hypothetical protein
MTVKFGSTVKPFLFPAVINNGYLTKYDGEPAPSKQASTPDGNDLIEALKRAGFKYIDNRDTSSNLWVLYEPSKVDDFIKIVSKHNVQYSLERRGSLATGNAIAWRIMLS